MFFGISLAGAQSPSFVRRCLPVSSARRVGNRFGTVPRSRARSANGPCVSTLWIAIAVEGRPEHLSSASTCKSLVGCSCTANQTAGCAPAPNRSVSSRQLRPSTPRCQMRKSGCHGQRSFDLGSRRRQPHGMTPGSSASAHRAQPRPLGDSAR